MSLLHSLKKMSTRLSLFALTLARDHKFTEWPFCSESIAYRNSFLQKLAFVLTWTKRRGPSFADEDGSLNVSAPPQRGSQTQVPQSWVSRY